MQKKYTSLGLMSGTSGDGVDASIINSNGVNEFESIKDKYYEYDDNIFREIHEIKEKINSKNDLVKLIPGLNELERKITLFHAKIVNELAEKNKEWFQVFMVKLYIIIHLKKFLSSQEMQNFASTNEE